MVCLTTGVGAQTVNNKKMLSFNARFGAQELKESLYYPINDKDSIAFEVFRFYISGIELWNGNNLVWQEQNSYHLIDLFTETKQIMLSIPEGLNYNSIVFCFGIDSSTNVSGAMGGDLDPTTGMYWTWQSGYINLKMEGKSNTCNTRNHTFQYHLGGYQYPYNTLQKIKLDLVHGSEIQVSLEVKELLKQLNLERQPELMSPCTEAVSLCGKIAQLFKLQK